MTKKPHDEDKIDEGHIKFQEISGDWGTVTGDYIISDGEQVILAHHAADEFEDEWTEIRKNGELVDTKRC